MAQVLLKDVYKKYETRDEYTVKGVNLEIKDKEFMILVGPSGCGKTTTLRMVAGLEDITKGEVYIGDRLVNDVPPKDRDIAMVFQNYALYPHMNVYDNMAFGLKLRKTPKSEIDRRVLEAAKILGIEDYLSNKPKELSGGQRQRVALGRAIVRNPKVFLMDEPLSNLDAKLRVHMRAEIIKLHQKLETTIIYVTHDQVEAMTMGDKIAIFNNGIIQQVGRPQEVYKNPANMFVAGFIGSPSMNFFKGVVVKEDSNLYFKTDAFKLKLFSEIKEKLQSYVDKKVIIGLRPENFQVKGNTTLKEDGNLVKAVIDVIEPMGNEYFLNLKAGKDSFMIRVSSKVNPVAGESIELLVDMEEIRVFDITTEKNILMKKD
jgi:multiple sugar transport system ATP-binding protein